MPMRKVNKSDFEGKTVQNIDARAANVIKFTFTDGATLEIWAETFSSLGIPIMGVYYDTRIPDIDIVVAGKYVVSGNAKKDLNSEVKDLVKIVHDKD